MAPTSERVENTVSDLVYLQDTYQPAVSQHDLRRGSAIIRRLLVDGELQRTWKEAGFQREPQIEAPSLIDILYGGSLAAVEFAAAGGATVNGMYIAGIVVSRHALWGPGKVGANSNTPPSVVHGLKRFSEAPVIFAHQTFVTRHQIIKYIANKRGGVHYDTQRGNAKDEQAFAVLDKLEHNVTINDHYPVYYELHAAVQLLVRAPDIQQFIRAVRGF